MHDLVLSVVGLGKIGSPLLAFFASRGYRVIGLDVNDKVLELIRAGRAPVPEPGLEELLRAHGERISITQDYDLAVLESAITFVVVPTPSERNGTYSLKLTQAVCERIGGVLQQKTGFHLIVVTSTVLPQDMDERVLPVLENSSGKTCGQDFGLCYNPEFVAVGHAVRDIQHPDFVLIGQSDERSGSLLERVYRTALGEHVPVVRTNFVNAELAKIAVNTFVTTKISYANMLAEVCEQIPGCDVDVVTSALGLDSRIGTKYLKGRLGYGGPCFPRDNIAFAAMAHRRGVQATLAEATDALNRRQVSRILKRIRGLVKPWQRIGVLGLTYNPHTDVVEESQGLHLAKALAEEGFSVIVYDPLGMQNARAELEDAVEYAASAEACIQASHMVAIATPWDEFKRLTASHFAHNPRRVVLDCWRILPADEISQVADYITVGRLDASPIAAERAPGKNASLASRGTGPTERRS